MYRFENRRLAALERASYGEPEVDKTRWARVVEQWPQWVSLHPASCALGLSLSDFARLGRRCTGTYPG